MKLTVLACAALFGLAACGGSGGSGGLNYNGGSNNNSGANNNGSNNNGSNNGGANNGNAACARPQPIAKHDGVVIPGEIDNGGKTPTQTISSNNI